MVHRVNPPAKKQGKDTVCQGANDDSVNSEVHKIDPNHDWTDVPPQHGLRQPDLPIQPLNLSLAEVADRSIQSRRCSVHSCSMYCIHDVTCTDHHGHRTPIIKDRASVQVVVGKMASLRAEPVHRPVFRLPIDGSASNPDQSAVQAGGCVFLRSRKRLRNRPLNRSSD